MSRRALVTGGTGALGRAVLERLARDGYDLVVASRHPPADSAAVAPTFVGADVTDESSVADLVRAAGPVDALVHLVGVYRGGATVPDTSVEDWGIALELNLTSAFLCARAVLPGMLERNWGRLVFASSRSARRGLARNAAYSVAKAGLATLAEAIAGETRGTGVTANVVAPSTIDTASNRAAWPGADHDRWVAPETVAAAISYLVSDPAGDLRGGWLPVYGGI